MNQELMNVYIEQIWRPFIEKVADEKGSLLILDSFSAHKTTEIMEAFQKADTKCVIIPGGCTSKVQPLDVSVNKPFRNFLRAYWMRHVHHQVERIRKDALQDPATKIPTASKS